MILVDVRNKLRFIAFKNALSTRKPSFYALLKVVVHITDRSGSTTIIWTYLWQAANHSTCKYGGFN